LSVIVVVVGVDMSRNTRPRQPPCNVGSSALMSSMMQSPVLQPWTALVVSVMMPADRLAALTVRVVLSNTGWPPL
jgi:hypothetical protein